MTKQNQHEDGRGHGQIWEDLDGGWQMNMIKIHYGHEQNSQGICLQRKRIQKTTTCMEKEDILIPLWIVKCSEGTK